MVVLGCIKWPPELKQEKPLIGISYSTEAITVMANLSSGECFRAIMDLLFCVTMGILHRVQLAILVNFPNAVLNAKRSYNQLKFLVDR